MKQRGESADNDGELAHAHRHSPDRISLPIQDPYALVESSGGTIACNDAFLALASSRGSTPDLMRLFGSAALEALATAVRDGHSMSHLPLPGSGATLRMMRVCIRRDPERGVLGVLLTDTTDELASRRQLFERNRELQVLNDIGRALSETLDVDELCRRVFDQAERVLVARSFYIAIWDRETNIVHFPLFIEEDLLKVQPSRPFGTGLTEYLLQTGRPLMLHGDVFEESEKLGVKPVGRPSRAWLGTPMLASGQPFGVIAIQDFDAETSYGAHDLELLTLIAAQAAAAIYNARLYAESRRAYEELAATQQKLIESERLRSITETVGALNHEVNNPLASIAGNAQLLLRHPGLDDPARHKVEIVLDAARRIQQVTSRMSSIIQATTMPYPGGTPILDVRRSVVRDDRAPDAARPAAAARTPRNE